LRRLTVRFEATHDVFRRRLQRDGQAPRRGWAERARANVRASQLQESHERSTHPACWYKHCRHRTVRRGVYCVGPGNPCSLDEAIGIPCAGGALIATTTTEPCPSPLTLQAVKNAQAEVNDENEQLQAATENEQLQPGQISEDQVQDARQALSNAITALNEAEQEASIC